LKYLKPFSDRRKNYAGAFQLLTHFFWKIIIRYLQTSILLFSRPY